MKRKKPKPVSRVTKKTKKIVKAGRRNPSRQVSKSRKATPRNVVKKRKNKKLVSLRRRVVKAKKSVLLKRKRIVGGRNKRAIGKRRPTRKGKKGRKDFAAAQRTSLAFDRNTRGGLVTLSPTGKTFEQKLASVRNSGFDFLNRSIMEKGLRIGKFPAPQAVVVIIKTASGKVKGFFNTKTSPPDMVINPENVKQFVLERMVEYQDNYLERLEDNDGEDLTGSGKVFNPKNIVSITLRFIY